MTFSGNSTSCVAWRTRMCGPRGRCGSKTPAKGSVERSPSCTRVPLTDEKTPLDREIAPWANEMHRVQRARLPALERLLQGLRDTKPAPSPTITLVHGDAKPGNFAFVND